MGTKSQRRIWYIEPRTHTATTRQIEIRNVAFQLANRTLSIKSECAMLSDEKGSSKTQVWGYAIAVEVRPIYYPNLYHYICSTVTQDSWLELPTLRYSTALCEGFLGIELGC